ncbi:ABC transporter permease [candidate division KSB1 bacterium]
MEKNKIKLPKYAHKLCEFLLPYEVRKGGLQDFERTFTDLSEKKGKFTANIWFWIQVIQMIPSFLFDRITWSIIMFKNYLKITLRNIKRHWGYSFINISGLAVGLACCILILLWLQDELSFDRFHENTNELYRVISKIPASNVTVNNARTPNALGAALVEQFPEVVDFTRYQCFENRLLEIYGKSHLNNLAVGDRSFFKMFSFQFISGDNVSCLYDRYSIVLTESTAKKYFGNEDPVGKIINIVLGPKIRLTVTGVIKDTPENSHLHFDCIIPFFNASEWWGADQQDWNITMYYTYVQLQKDSDPEEVNKKISGIIKNHNKTSLAEIYLQPLKDIHLSSKLAGDFDNYKQGDIKYVYIYCLTALCVLMIAGINFVNLSTARSSRRAKEIGIRKVSGGQKKHLFSQFLGESVFLSLFALFLAFILVFVTLPTFNTLTNKNLALNFSQNLFILTAGLAVAVITGAISGVYPAIFLSSLRPVNAIRDSALKTGRTGIVLRRLLIVIQFVLSVIFITGTLVVYSQLSFIRNKPLGYDNRNIINTYNFSLGTGIGFDVVEKELLENPNIVSITRAEPPNIELFGNSSFKWEGMEPEQEFTLYPVRVDYSYLKTFGMTLKEGRFFSREYGSDYNALVINETAAKVMGLDNPIGTLVSYEMRNFETDEYDEKEGEIIGIIKNFHQRSLHNSIEPMIFTLINDELGPYSLKIEPRNLSETIKFLEDKWKAYHPDYPFSYTFLSETINNFYENDKKTGTVFTYFALLTIFISCLGLIGLVSYTAEQRKKEIGIRKVLGSSITGVTLLLSKEFLGSIVISLIISFPLVWFIMKKWLEGFAYRTNIGIPVFLISGILTLCIAVLSVGFQVLKAASASPVDSIRNE